jgi:NADPH-dependent 2,4-dienoyl-CoA reductase/sulfur reductase-like enzyme
MSTSPQAEAAAAAPACPAPGHPNVTAATPHATRVAVVGSGITGLATAWLLHK